MQHYLKDTSSHYHFVLLISFSYNIDSHIPHHEMEKTRASFFSLRDNNDKKDNDSNKTTQISFTLISKILNLQWPSPNPLSLAFFISFLNSQFLL